MTTATVSGWRVQFKCKEQDRVVSKTDCEQCFASKMGTNVGGLYPTRAMCKTMNKEDGGE